jgi:hypothetical protein
MPMKHGADNRRASIQVYSESDLRSPIDIGGIRQVEVLGGDV